MMGMIDPIHDTLRAAIRDIPEYLGAIQRFLDTYPGA